LYRYRTLWHMTDSEYRDEKGRLLPKYDEEEILEAVGEHSPAATSEVADEVGCTRQNADYRLRQLEERGLVESKKIGAVLVWTLTDEVKA